jgi:hypothetical protein
VTVASGGTLDGGAVSVAAVEGITLADTDADTLALESAAVTFGDGQTNVDDTLTVVASGPVSDTAAASLSIGGVTTITAAGSDVSLDSASNDFKAAVRAAADTLTLRDANNLELAESTIGTTLDAAAVDDLAVSRSAVANAALSSGGTASVTDVTGDTVTVVAAGPATVAQFSVASLDLTSGGAMTVREGAASTGVTLRGNVDATVQTVLTPSLVAADLASATLDRVGAENASIAVTADEISLGVIRAQSADLEATAGDIRTTDSTERPPTPTAPVIVAPPGTPVVAPPTISPVTDTLIQVTRPNGSTLNVDSSDIAFTDRLVDVSGPLSVAATGNVSLTKAMNSGTTVNNALRDVVVDDTVGGALTVETRETINVSRSSPTNTVGSATVTGEQSVTADVNALGDARVVSTGNAVDNVLITGDVAGNASADGVGDATINATVANDATANAGETASVLGTIGRDARAEGGQDAVIDARVNNDATATGGNNATIGDSIGGDAVATATTNDALIEGLVEGNANAMAGRDATINGSTARIEGTATATAGRDAEVTGPVDGLVTATADNDAAVTGTMGNSVVANADNNILVSGDVTGDVTAIAGKNATVEGSVSNDALVTATNDALINAAVSRHANATGGQNATIQNEVGGNATATALAADALIEGTIVGDASATAAVNATIDATVGGTATANAGGDATIRGSAGVGATATAENDALIDATVTGDAFADASAGRNATILGAVSGAATAEAINDATLNSDVTGNATVTAGRDADASGTVTEDLAITADNAIVLGSKQALAVTGALTATADADASGGNTASITQVSGASVGGATLLAANGQSDIVLASIDNDFSDLTLRDAADVNVVDTDTLNVTDLANVTGDLTLETKEGALTLNDPGTAENYRIAANKLWTLKASAGDLILNGQIDGAGAASTSSLVLQGGEGKTIRIKNLVGSNTRLDNVTIMDATDVVFGLNSDAEIDDVAMINRDDFLLQPGADNDIFFATTMDVKGVDGQFVLLIPAETEFQFDFADRYFGINIEAADGFTYDGGERIDLFGKIGTTRSRATGLTPIGPRSGMFQFNNCLIGDPNSCSALTQANVLRLVDLTPENVFVLDPDQVEQLFLSFGNEELWGLPSVFAIDIEDEEDDEDESSEGTQ